MKKKLLAWISLLSLTFTMYPAYAAEPPVEATVVEADQTMWITNENGLAETQEIFTIPSDGSLPDYIESIEYAKDEDSFESDVWTDGEEIANEDSTEMVDFPITIPLEEGNTIASEMISITTPLNGGTAHLQIFDDDIDTSMLDVDIGMSSATESTVLQEGKPYSISLIIDYGDFVNGYYGYITVQDGQIVISDVWFIQTEKLVDFPIEDSIQPFAVTQQESEPNNTYSQADQYTNDADMYGMISSTYDVVYYKVIFGRDGKANFFLGNIPQNCNYDMKIYYQSPSGGSLVLYRTLATSGKKYEMVTDLPVESDKTYYMQLYSAKGYSTSKYQVRAKITPIDDSFEPNNTFGEAKVVTDSGYYLGTIHKAKDVDYYAVNTKAGVLNIILNNIPSGCNYQVAVYDSSKKEIATTTEGGSSKSLTVSVSSGRHYIKVYSKSGSNQTQKYRLTLSSRTPYTTISGTIQPKIKTSGGSALSETAIVNLPIRILYTQRGSTKQYTLKTVTTDASGKFSTAVSLPSNISKLYVATYPVDSSLSVQLLDGTVPTTLFELPYNTASATLTIGSNSTVSHQFLASMSIWRLGKNGLTAYSNLSQRNPKQLVIRCTAGKSEGTNANSQRIQLNGASNEHDYYDYDIILHEMGHWVMYNNGGIANFGGGSHGWGTPYDLGGAYNEGWAHYFSAAMRSTPTVLDYFANGTYFGGRLSDGYIKPGAGSSGFTALARKSPYTENAKYEINIGAALWNISRANAKKYGAMETIMARHFQKWQEFYDSYITTVSGSNIKTAWENCEKFHVAYDMEVPKVNLTISALKASMSATDNVAVSKYEWYVDGVLKSSGTGSSGSIDLSSLGLTTGTHTLLCRVYDPEGIADGPRPRTNRYGSASRSFVISGTSSLIDMEEMPTYHGSDADYLSVGGEALFTKTVEANMDLAISMTTSGAVKEITIIDPNGNVYAEVPYIAPDAPYIIKNAMPGEWSVRVTNYNADDLSAMGLLQEINSNNQFPGIELKLTITTAPTPVELRVPSVTNNRYILNEVVNDPDVIITQNGETIDPRQPLVDGEYIFTAVRKSGEMLSTAQKYDVCVDTVAPTMVFDGVPTTTERDRFVMTVKFSERISEMTVNGTPVELGACALAGFEVTDFWLLDPGENSFVITATDFAGNSTSHTLIVSRTTN